MTVAVGIIELAGSYSPEEGQETQCSEAKRDGYQVNQHFHQRTLKAFRVTMIDDVDIANAACSGVATPASARGTAIRL